jgi:peroxiredoxin
VSVIVSAPQPEKQASFDNKIVLRFPLLSDPIRRWLKRSGYGKKKTWQRKYRGIIAPFLLIDENGKNLKHGTRFLQGYCAESVKALEKTA